MQKIVLVLGANLKEVNKYLADGWVVKHILEL